MNITESYLHEPVLDGSTLIDQYPIRVPAVADMTLTSSAAIVWAKACMSDQRPIYSGGRHWVVTNYRQSPMGLHVDLVEFVRIKISSH
ncbi:hypothetical protein [uncultured Pseudomonas sp.]|uniref:hypothetical protein n=1 Tax=Pseudomonas juntendi TaxID=2666183 RepID=UPI0028DBAF56|nr:hypothetical protein [uncultured Pseudomonas sp.]